MWSVYAVGAAFFAALTAIFAKLGVGNVDSNLATAIRTSFILVLTWGIVLCTGAARGLRSLDGHTLFFLLLSALAILSIFRPDDLRRLVLEDDVLALTRVSGIGKKTAQHVFLELKYKLKVEDVPQAAVLAASGRPGSVFRDVLDGLANLGYAEEECAPLVKKILHEEPDLDVTGALRAALKALAKGRS